MPPGRPLRPRDRVPRRRARAARRGPRRPAPGRARRRRDRRAARRRPHGRADPRARASPASRSRSSAPTAASTGACPPSPRCRCPTTRGCSSGSRRCPASSRPSPTGDYDLIHVATPGPAGARRGADRPDRPDPAGREPPHRVRRLRAAADRQRGARRDDGPGDEPALPRVRDRALAEHLRRRLARAARRAAASGSPAGSAASTPSRFSPEHRTRPLDGTALRRPLRGPADPREGDRPARRRLHDRAPASSRASGSSSPATVPRPEALRERLGAERRAPRLARGRRARPCLRRRRRLPVRLPDRHLRAGRRRGPGERPAGRRGRRGRPRRPDRARAQRAARRARRPRAGGQARPPRPEPAAPRPARRRRDGGRAGAHLGALAAPSSPTATRWPSRRADAAKRAACFQLGAAGVPPRTPALYS